MIFVDAFLVALVITYIFVTNRTQRCQLHMMQALSKRLSLLERAHAEARVSLMEVHLRASAHDTLLDALLAEQDDPDGITIQ